MPQVLECDTDAEAIAAAGDHGARLEHGFHLWQLGRFVGGFELGADGIAQAVQAPFDPSGARG